MKSRRNVRIPWAIAALALVATAFAPGAFAKDGARETALRAAENARFEAQVNADGKALATLLDDGLEYSHSSGVLDTKASFIESLVSGSRDYVSTTADIESLRIFGDVGVIRGKAKMTVKENGASRDLDLQFSDVWLWKAGRWQMTAWRSAKPPAPAAQ